MTTRSARDIVLLRCRGGQSRLSAVVSVSVLKRYPASAGTPCRKQRTSNWYYSIAVRRVRSAVSDLSLNCRPRPMCNCFRTNPMTKILYRHRQTDRRTAYTHWRLTVIDLRDTRGRVRAGPIFQLGTLSPRHDLSTGQPGKVTIFVTAQKYPYHVTFDLDLDLEHNLNAGLPGDHRVQVWWRSGHLSERQPIRWRARNIF